MAWDVYFITVAEEWILALNDDDYTAMLAAIVLLGGDKRGDWTGWYERNIPTADDLYDEHLRNLEHEG